MSTLAIASGEPELQAALLLNSHPATLQGSVGKLLKDVRRNVAFYRNRFSGTAARALGPMDVLRSLRPVSKVDLLGESMESLTNARFEPSLLRRESTSGSTGQPFTIALHRSYIARRNLRFLRALLDVGYRPGHRMMLLTRSTRPKGGARFGWHHQSYTQSPDVLLRQYQQLKPQILYGCVTPLRLLAEHARATGQQIHRPAIVITTAEMLNVATEHLLHETFDAPVADFYGSTEMGLVAWRAPDAPFYKTFDRSIVIELHPYAPAAGWYELLLTNLELRSMPMLRLKVGDLAEVKAIDGVPRIVGFQGREIDVLWDGDKPVSPYMITDQLWAVPGLKRFQVTQTSLKAFAVSLECDPGYEPTISRQIESLLQRIFGEDVEIEQSCVDRIPVEGLRKHRPVRSLVRR